MLENYVIDQKNIIDGTSAWIHFGDSIGDSIPVAIKFSKESDPKTLARFKQENRILKELADIEHVIDVFTEVLYGPRSLKQHKYYYIMEKADDSLNGWLDLNSDEDVYDLKIAIIKQLLTTIKQVHSRGYIHRDLHYENVLIKIDEDRIISKLTDFGQSFDLNAGLKLTKIGRIAWGELFMPPEICFDVIKNDNPLYKNGDLYALGLVIKHMFTLGVDVYTMLVEMHDSIRKFKKSKLGKGELPENYSKIRNLSLRKQDYAEWCKKEEADKPFRSLIDTSDFRDDQVSYVIRMMAALDYESRESDINVVISAMEGI